uniref:Uncharacterized protein n=1 Tax=Oryzias melastigma TaxID=30732 RepID=A0A3B3CW16_ORYME
MGTVFTEIHKSSLLLEFFFFFVSNLEVVAVSPQQRQQLLAWRQQQQWQHTSTAVRRTSRGSVRTTARQILQSWLKKSWMLSIFHSMVLLGSFNRSGSEVSLNFSFNELSRIFSNISDDLTLSFYMLHG